MWITYSCLPGLDRTTYEAPPQRLPRPQLTQHCRQVDRKMVSKDIPLDSGWMEIHCTGGCPIVINKVINNFPPFLLNRLPRFSLSLFLFTGLLLRPKAFVQSP